MKTITKEVATQGVWNFIERGEFPEHTANVLLTIYRNNQLFVVAATYNDVQGYPIFLDENGVDYNHTEAISWQYPPAPSKRTYKEEWMSQWVNEGEAWEHPSGYDFCLARFVDGSGVTFYWGYDTRNIGEAPTKELAMDACYEHFTANNP